jgi:hypothetical protein
MDITNKQANYILMAIEWAIGDGMHSPDKEESQIIQQLQAISREDK